MGNNGPIIGNSVELGQQVAGLPSGMNRQDFYSNSLGYGFYKMYNDSAVQMYRFFSNIFGVNSSFATTVKNYLSR